MGRFNSALRGRAVTWVITACCSSSLLLFGYDQGVMSGILTGDAFTSTFPAIDTANGGSTSLQGTVVAIYEIGALCGALITFAFAEYLGRRRSIALGCIILTIGATLQCTSYSIAQLIAARVITGVGTGINTSTVPTWQSELSSQHDRGKLVCIEFAIEIFGLAIAYWVDYGFSYVKSSASFRFPLAFQIFFAIVSLVLLVFCPESPRWLLKHGKVEEAQFVLEQISLHTGEDATLKVAEEFSIIQAALREEEEATPKDKNGNPIPAWRAVFTNGKERYLHRMLLGVGAMAMQQLGGINLITYYAPVVFEQSVGLSVNLSNLLSGFIGIVFFLASCIPIFIIDKVGRRKLMMISVAGQSICLIILTVALSFPSYGTGVLAATMFFAYDCMFAIGIFPGPWLVGPEYAALPVRQASSALSVVSNWAFTFLIVEITPSSIASIGQYTYCYLAAFNAVFVPIIYFFYPETAGLPLEQIDLLFTGPKVLLHLPPELRDAHVGDESGMGRVEADAITQGDSKEVARHFES